MAHTQSVNDTFRSAGVQFYVQSVEQYSMPGLTDLKVDDSANITWGQIRSGLRQALPNIPCNAFLSSKTKKFTDWLVWASLYYAPTDSIPIWTVSGYGHGFGIYPWRGRSIIWDPYFINTLSETNYAHEIGHFFGLPHSFQSQNLYHDASYTLERNTIRDPTTAGTYLGFDAFWDLVYKKIPGSPDVFYNRMSDATANESALVGKETWDIPPPNDPSTCTLDANCTYTCSMDDGNWSTGTNPAMNGVSFQYKGDNPSGGVYKRGVNVMGYNQSAACVANSLSGSQGLQIRKVLRYEMPLDDQISFPGKLGKRPLLGMARPLPSMHKIDFDGDGKRDALVWEPPPSTTSSGTFRLLPAASFDPPGTPITRSFGKLGDVPVPADYSGDGKTDYAVWRTNYDSSGNIDLTSNTAYWYYCDSTLPNCNSPTLIPNNSLRTDVPLPGTNFDGNSSTSEVAYFRPSDGTIHWRVVGSGSESVISTGGPGYGKIPLIDKYDIDSATDVVLYDPSTAKFDIVFSSNWSNHLTYQFPSTLVAGSGGSVATSAQRSGGVVSQGSYSNATYCVSGSCYSYRVRTLQVYSPDDGVWYTYIPYYGLSGTPTTCAFGGPGDIPLSGMIDMDNDGTSDYAIYRAEGTIGATSGAGTIYIRNDNCSGPDHAVSNTSTNSRTAVSATGDMTGDGQSDMIRIDPDTMTWYILRSEGYIYKYQFQLGAIGAMAF